MPKHVGVFYDLLVIYILLCAFVVECNWFEPTDKLLFPVYGFIVFRVRSFGFGSKSAKFGISVFVSSLWVRWFKALLLTEESSSHISLLADKQINCLTCFCAPLVLSWWTA